MDAASGHCKCQLNRPRRRCCCVVILLLQVKSVKQVAEFVSQLRRVGKGLGVWEFDRKLAADVAAGLVA